MSLRSAAISYARAGRKVFPCAVRGKEPFLEGGMGFLGATNVVEVIERWWDKWPNCNIGMACAPSGFFAVDVDPRNNGGQTWTRLRGFSPLPPCDKLDCPVGCPDDHAQMFEGDLLPMPDTREAETGSGGWHFLFNLPQVPEGKTWKGGLGPGVDLKVNGYIIVAPSIHPNGHPYRWTNNYGLADAPDWLLKLCFHEPAVVPKTGTPGMYERAPWFCRGALDRECERVATAPKGERNRTLNSAAFNLGGLVSLGLAKELIEERLLVASSTMNDLTLREATKTLRSGLAAGIKRPRGIPERKVRR